MNPHDESDSSATKGLRPWHVWVIVASILLAGVVVGGAILISAGEEPSKPKEPRVGDLAAAITLTTDGWKCGLYPPLPGMEDFIIPLDTLRKSQVYESQNPQARFTADGSVRQYLCELPAVP